MTWHLPAQTLRGYLAGTVSETAAWSVEAHLAECERCRTLLAQVSAADGGLRQRLDYGWASLAVAIPPQGDVPAGTRWREARMLLAGGPAARGAWLVACTIVLVLAAALGLGTSRVPWLGVVAPLVPLLGVAASYGSRLDAAHEVIAATPAGGLRLLLVRTASVLAATTPVALTAGYVSGYGSPAPWLLASLALTLASLALGSVLGIERAASVLAGVWIVAVSGAFLDPLWRQPVVLTVDAMPWMLAVAAAAAAVIAVRRESFNQLAVHSRIEVLR